MGIWKDAKLVSLQATGFDVEIERSGSFFVCEVCKNSFSNQELAHRLLSRRPHSAHDLRIEVWQDWKGLLKIPQPVVQDLDAIATEGWVSTDRAHQVLQSYPNMWIALTHAHVWLLPPAIASIFEGLPEENTAVFEQWFVGMVPSVKYRPLSKLSAKIRDPVIEQMPPISDSKERLLDEDASITTLHLAEATLKTLGKYRIETIGELCSLSPEELSEYPYIGKHVLVSIQSELEKFGWSLNPKAERIWKSRYHGKEVKRGQFIRARAVLGEEDFNLLCEVRFSLSESARIEARNKIVLRHIGLAKKFAQMYVGAISSRDRMWDFDDLFMEAIVGLIAAIKQFDLSYGLRFSTFASHWIRNLIWSTIMRRGALTAHEMRGVVTLEKVTKQFVADEGRNPSSEELRALLGLSENQVASVMVSAQFATNRQWLSMDAPIEEGDTVRGDFFTSSQNTEREFIRATFNEHVRAGLAESSLLTCDRWLLAEYWGLNGPAMTIQYLAKCLGVETEEVGIRLKAAHDQIRTEEFWDSISWYYPKFHRMPFAHIVPKYIQIEETIAGKVALSSLTERERIILQHRMGIWGSKRKSLEELGERFSVTRERIRQLEGKVVRTLKLDREIRGLLHDQGNQSKNRVNSDLNLDFNWPWANTLIVVEVLTEIARIKGSFWEHVHGSAGKEVLRLFCYILFLRGWSSIRIANELAMEGSKLDNSEVKAMIEVASAFYAGSANAKHELIATVSAINRHRYSRQQGGSNDDDEG